MKFGLSPACEGLNRKGKCWMGVVAFLGRGTFEEFIAVNYVSTLTRCSNVSVVVVVAVVC